MAAVGSSGLNSASTAGALTPAGPYAFISPAGPRYRAASAIVTGPGRLPLVGLMLPLSGVLGVASLAVSLVVCCLAAQPDQQVGASGRHRGPSVPAGDDRHGVLRGQLNDPGLEHVVGKPLLRGARCSLAPGVEQPLADQLACDVAARDQLARCLVRHGGSLLLASFPRPGHQDALSVLRHGLGPVWSPAQRAESSRGCTFGIAGPVSSTGSTGIVGPDWTGAGRSWETG